MHELAAPLLYVIRTDCETFSSLRASLGQGSGDPGRSKALAELVATVPPGLLDLAMVEADTFSLFEALMEGQLADWYRTSGSRHSSPGEKEPWGRPQDRTSGNPLVSSLNNIQDVLLRRHDPPSTPDLRSSRYSPKFMASAGSDFFLEESFRSGRR